METGKPSYMAERTARLRAAHQILDDNPKIFEDPLAMNILGADIEASIKQDLERLQTPILRRARTFIVVRARYAEDELKAAIERGIKQILILGAGLDTLAYRDIESLNTLRIFEVDHPNTQLWKLDKLRTADISVPDNLRHTSVDFERNSLTDMLTAGGFNFNLPTFVSWLGVTYYLERDAIFKMFEFVARLPRFSQIVFDFLLEETELDDEARQSVDSARRRAEPESEPLQSRFTSDALRTKLSKIGYNNVVWLSPDQARDRYLKDRRDGLSLDSSLQLMSATV
jgi:methyltransferase (TIGR00027 family)